MGHLKQLYHHHQCQYCIITPCVPLSKTSLSLSSVSVFHNHHHQGEGWGAEVVILHLHVWHCTGVGKWLHTHLTLNWVNLMNLDEELYETISHPVNYSFIWNLIICVSIAPASLSFTCQQHQCCHEIRQSKLTSGHHQLKETEKSSRCYLDLATSSSCCSCRAGITLSISETMTQSLPYSHVKYEERKTTKVMSSNSIHHV